MKEYRPQGAERMLLPLGLFLLNILFFSLTVSTLSLMAGIPVGPLCLPAAVLLAAAAALWLQRRSLKAGAAAVAAGLAVLLLCLLLAGYVPDWSWDGNSYHKGIAGALCWGWNPLRESFYDFAAPYPFLSHCVASWYDAYPKATELFSACIHSLTGNIEAGKASNLLSLIAVFLLCWEMLLRTGVFKCWQCALCSGLMVLNPVSVSQLFTFYNDGALGNMLLLCLAALLYCTVYPQGERKPLAGYCIFASIGIGFNLKFSALVFFAILCLTFFGYWTVRVLRAGRPFAPTRALGRMFLLLAGSVAFGTLFLGATSYVTNTVRYHNPVYTMLGPGSTEIILSEMPAAYRSMGNLGSFIASLFSRCSTSLESAAVEWKLPFTFSPPELRAALSCDVRTAGWGVAFSGILLLSAAVIVWALSRCRRSRPEVFRLTLLLSAMLAGAVLLVPGLARARYFTALFLVPAAALLYLFAWWNRSGGKRQLVCAWAVTVLLLANLAPNLGGNLLLLKDAGRSWAQLEQLRQLTQTEQVILSFCGKGRFEGRLFNVYDAGITDFTYGYIHPDDYTGTVFDYCPLYYYVVP